MAELQHASDDALGDLSDVPPHCRNEVVKTLTCLNKLWSQGLAGGVSELREWISQLQRLSGYSREVCKQLCLAMSRCLGSDRQGSPSTLDLQSAFVRMGGVRHTCCVMMLRLSDDVIVAHVLQVLTAAVQNAPLVAEAFQLDELNNLKLVLRTLERHKASWEVAEAGCKLIGHICSRTAVAQGNNRPIRSKSHRDCQTVLAREGAMDVVVDIIELYGKEIKDCANKAEKMSKDKIRQAAQDAEAEELMSEEVTVGRPKLTDKKKPTKMGIKDRIAKVQANLELRNVWQRLMDKELAAGKVQEAALQALNLLIEGNNDTTRQLAGVLWVQHMNVVLNVGESFLNTAEKLADAKKAALRKQEDSDDDSTEGGSPTGMPRKKGGKVKLPQGEARKAMTSLESLSHKLHIAVDVMRGHACRDRPSLAGKACVLAIQLLKHHKTQIERVNNNAEIMRREAANRRGGPVVDDNRKVKAPFGALLTTVQAIVSMIRIHIENTPVLTSAMSLLAELRSNALLSVPAGMQVGGSDALKAFQALLIQAGGKDTEWLMRLAAKRLVKAAKTSEQGDLRIADFGKSPSELEGNGDWLTPRMRKDADQARSVAEGLAGDALRGSWEDFGEPGRWDKVLKRRNELAEKARRKEEKRLAAEMGFTVEEYRAHIAFEETLIKKDDETSTSSGSGSYFEPDPEVEEEDLMGEQEWVRAVGFGAHDQADFDRMWRKPITEAIRRCLPEKAPEGSKWAHEAQEKKKKLEADAAALGVSLEDSLDELLVVEMLESEQGKMKVKATVRPQDKLQSNVINMRARDLSKPETTAKSITCELSKNLTKSGYLLPKYGIGVKLGVKSASAANLSSPTRKSIVRPNL